MLTCANCQFANPVDHNFCQRCGESLKPATAAPEVTPGIDTKAIALQAKLVPPKQIKLSPAAYLDASADFSETNTGSGVTDAEQQTGRYQVLTVLNQSCAYVTDTTPEVRSPLQTQLAKLKAQPNSHSLEQLQTIESLPAAAYPYLLLNDAAPPLYDAWEQQNTTLLIVSERPAVSSIIKAFSTAIDPLQHVYWMYRLIELWTALSPIPQWRSSLLLADNLGIDTDQSVLVEQFILPVAAADSPGPGLSELKAFLQSLLAQPHRGAVDTLRQIRQLILAVSSAQTLEQLSQELANIGKALLETPAAITPTSSPAAVESPTIPVPTTMPPKSTAATDQPDAGNSNFETGSETDSVDKTLVVDTPPEDDPPNETPIETPIEGALTQETPAAPVPIDDALLEQALLQDTILQDSAGTNGPSEIGEATMVLPMKLGCLEDAGQTDVGRQRDHNEDCFLISRSSQQYSDNYGHLTQAHGLYVLCDGMGGHDGGEVASTLAAKTLRQYFETHWPTPSPGEAPNPLPNESTIVEAVMQANQAIYDVNEQEQRAGHERMGTTLVAVLIQGTSAVVVHVGDSRLYQHSRRLGLQQVTVDHEVGQREIERGVDPETAYARPDAYQLTQALGPRGKEDLDPSVSYLTFTEDTLLLLCSDGLSDNDVVEDYLESHIDPMLREKIPLSTGVNKLVQLSNEVNGHDNITAIAIRLQVSPDLNKGRLT